MPPTPPPPTFPPIPAPMAGMEPSLHATCSFSGPLPLPWQNRYLWGTGHHMGCLCYQPPHLPPLLTPPPQNHFLGHPSCLPRVLFPCSLQRSTQGFVTVSTPLPFLLRIILYSSFQTIQYSLGYSYYYQVAGIVKVGVVRALAFIPYFFVLLSMCINY